MRMTLRKGDILRGYGAFSDVIARGGSRAFPPLRLFYRIDPAGSPGIKAGFATSRQIRNAASRNRLKRLLREAFRLHRDQTGLEEAGKRAEIRLVILYTGNAGRKATTVPLTEIQSSLAPLLKSVAESVSGKPA